MDVETGDKVQIDIALVRGTTRWTQKVTRLGKPCLPTAFGSGNPCSVSYELDMLGQTQSAFIFSTSGSRNASFYFDASLSNIKIEADQREPATSWCTASTGVSVNETCTDIKLSEDLKTCTVAECVLKAKEPRPANAPLPDSTASSSSTTNTTGSKPTYTLKSMGQRAVSTSWFLNAITLNFSIILSAILFSLVL
jgi:hypothetical protein